MAPRSLSQISTSYQKSGRTYLKQVDAIIKVASNVAEADDIRMFETRMASSESGSFSELCDTWIQIFQKCFADQEWSKKAADRLTIAYARTHLKKGHLYPNQRVLIPGDDAPGSNKAGNLNLYKEIRDVLLNTEKNIDTMAEIQLARYREMINMDEEHADTGGAFSGRGYGGSSGSLSTMYRTSSTNLSEFGFRGSSASLAEMGTGRAGGSSSVGSPFASLEGGSPSGGSPFSNRAAGSPSVGSPFARAAGSPSVGSPFSSRAAQTPSGGSPSTTRAAGSPFGGSPSGSSLSTGGATVGASKGSPSGGSPLAGGASGSLSGGRAARGSPFGGGAAGGSTRSGASTGGSSKDSPRGATPFGSPSKGSPRGAKYPGKLPGEDPASQIGRLSIGKIGRIDSGRALSEEATPRLASSQAQTPGRALSEAATLAEAAGSKQGGTGRGEKRTMP